MRTDLIGFIAVSENRKKIVKTLLEYPSRQWSCSVLEDMAKLPHATVFRTLNGLKRFGILKTSKVNRRDIIYELAGSPILKELERAINIERVAAKSIALNFVNKIKPINAYSAVLYGSSVKGDITPESDIDVLIILGRRDKSLEKEILDIAAEVSSEANKTISAVVMGIRQIQKEINSKFIKSVKANMEVLYGKKPF